MTSAAIITATVLGAKAAGAIVVSGCLLWFGFYIGKKVTNRLDEYFLTRAIEKGEIDLAIG